MQVQPYLFFAGNCAEAVEFYRTALGAEVKALMRYKDSPEPLNPEVHPPGSENHVMHAAFRIGETLVMASDDPTQKEVSHKGFSLSLSASDDAEAERLFAALADGGQVFQPLIQTFFSSRFGMAADRFGVPWMVTVASPQNA